MIRYKRVNDILLKKIDYEVPEVFYDDSVVDDTMFAPNINDVRNYLAAGKLGTTRKGEYMFPDGKDDGLRLGPIVDKGADITEVEAYKQTLENSVDNSAKIIESERDAILKEELEKAEAQKVLVAQEVNDGQ